MASEEFARFFPLPLRQWAALAVVDEVLHLLMLLAQDALIGSLFGLNHETSGSRFPSPACDGKARPREGTGLAIYDLSLRPLFLDQPRVRERIMKLSKVYSATCHHRYSSER